MNYALRGAGARYDVKPARETAISGPLAGFAGMSKDVCQGACAGFLALIGATHLTGGESVLGASGSNIAFLDQIWSSMAANGLAGPVELLGGIALFLAARRTISRTAGLMIFVAMIAAFANGYTLNDAMALLSNLLQGAAGAIDSIPAAQSA